MCKLSFSFWLWLISTASFYLDRALLLRLFDLLLALLMVFILIIAMNPT